MKTIIAMITLCVLHGSILAQQTTIPVRITETSIVGSESKTFNFAADVRATMGIDAALGEFEIPPFPPPTGLFVWTQVEVPDEVWLSPKDIRQLRSEKYVEDYHVHLQKSDVTTVRFSLTAGIPQYVDSIYLLDDYGLATPLYSSKLEAGQQYTVTNTALKKFIFRVYYNGTSVSVQDNEPHSPSSSTNNDGWAPSLSVAPNPASSATINVQHVSADAIALDVVDVRGVTCASHDVTGSNASLDVVGGLARGLNVSALPNGVYVLIERRLNGSIRHCMFMRQ